MASTFSGALRSLEKTNKEEDPFADWGSPERSPLEQLHQQTYLRPYLQEQRPTEEVVANCFADALFAEALADANSFADANCCADVKKDSNQLDMSKFADWGFAPSRHEEDGEDEEEEDQQQEQDEAAISCKGSEDLKGGRASAASTRVPSAASSLVDSRPCSTAFSGDAYSRSGSRCESRGYPAAFQGSAQQL